MSDRMTPIPFGDLMEWILDEHRKGAVFGIHNPFIADPAYTYELFGRKLETPFGPAAGPHTQLAQNIIAAYVAGSRFFELKTVQKLDGRDITVAKPCIKADDECYNVEWSTELYVQQAFDEYVKAWVALKVLAKEFGYGAMDGFQFNLSVGYDMEGIKLPKIDRFIEGLKDASQTDIFKECKTWLNTNLGRFHTFMRSDIENINSDICNSATLSTMHGCPSWEIEKIAGYLLTEKNLHTFIKCNPTLLGYEYVRNVMDAMGYEYVSFGEFHFKDDLQYEDAVPMIQRLRELADSRGLVFGVKLTNTCPVDITKNELPGEEMYMSGKSLYILTMSAAEKLSRSFDGKLRVSYSGGADYFNISDIVGAGIWPVTVATTLLKPGGYQRLVQIAGLFAGQPATDFVGVDVAKVASMVTSAKTDAHYIKAKKPLPSRKICKPIPLTDCFIAPCEERCPIHQDITTYSRLVKDGRYEEALRVIISKNPLPFITGTICYHTCMSACTRNFYESPVNIRRTKLEAAEGGYDSVMADPPKPAAATGKTTVVIGGGPAGLAAAYFLQLGGVRTVVIEKEAQMGGAVRYSIPGSQIRPEVIDKDIRLIAAVGVTMINNRSVTDFAALRKEFDYVVLAVGAAGAGYMRQKGAEDKPVPGALYKKLGIAVNEKGRPQIDRNMKTSLDNVYAAGDGTHGVASVVESIHDGRMAADAILGKATAGCQCDALDDDAVYAQRGILAEESRNISDGVRCLHCDSICEVCVEVCPNRANISVAVPGMEKHQVVHIDYMCNECGNCRSFCPWSGAPYQDKFTLFANEADMADSENQGFVVLDAVSGRCSVRLQEKTFEHTVGGTDMRVPEVIDTLMQIIIRDYRYLLLQ